MTNETFHYFSLQFSAIQKTVLRHDRLWSIAGVSHMLSRLNEIELPAIAERHGGQAIVAGGGKFTARFSSESDAARARRECIRQVATWLPMLEFQVSSIAAGSRFKDLLGDNGRNRLLEELREQKQAFRGYGFSFNPHLLLCEECGVYPAEKEIRRPDRTRQVCRTCHAAFEESRQLLRTTDDQTMLQRIYQHYLKQVPDAPHKVPGDFQDLFPEGTEHRKRLAVWFSDLNNMNDKIPVWLGQDNEAHILQTFDQFHATVITIVVDALMKTFPAPRGDVLPFRLIVAGGDDLCLVMAEKHILSFAAHLSQALYRHKQALDANHPLHDAWLKKHAWREGDDFKPFSFGSAFVVTSPHTPFSRIHQVGETLMSTAKVQTRRLGNSINWRIDADADSVSDRLFRFERPLFISRDDREKKPEALTFEDYLDLRTSYATVPSRSHRQQIIGILQQSRSAAEADRRLKMLDASARGKGLTTLLRDRRFRNAAGELLPERLATLFELLSIDDGQEVST